MSSKALRDIQNGKFVGHALIPIDDYDADRNYLRNTWVAAMMRSPAHTHYLMRTEGGSKDTPAFLFGRALHAAVLEPHLNKVVRAPDVDRRTKSGKERHEIFLSENAGKIVLSPDDHERLSLIQEKLALNRDFEALMQKGTAEESFFAVDPDTSLKLKIRTDYSRLKDANVIIDIKTTDNANPEKFEDSISRYYYDHQAAYYCHTASLATGKPVKDFIFLVIEKEPPFEISLCQLNEASLEKGMELVRENLNRIAQCRAENNWPGYGSGIHQVGLKSWRW